MPLSTLIASQTFGTQINDGDSNDDFDLAGGSLPYLHGNVTDIVYAQTKFLIKWYTELNANKIAQLIVTNGSPNMWLSSTSDFIQDGWQVGDQFTFTETIYSVTGTITSVASDTMLFNVISFVGVTQSMFFTSGDIIGTNTLDAAIIDYNLIENSAATTYSSALDNTVNSYYVSGMNTNTAYKNCLPFINGVDETWIDNTDFNSPIQMKARNLGLDSNDFQEIVVEHTFCIIPFYLQGFNTNLTNGTLPLDWFQSNKSVKYIIRLDARPQVGNANSSKVVESTNTLGDVGFFNETFNGLPNYQTIYDLEYNSGANTSLVKVGSNQITFKIKTNSPSYPNFLTSNIIKANFSLAKNPNDYIDSTRFKEQFLFSTYIKDGSDFGKDGVIDSVVTTIDPLDNSILNVTINTTFTAAESNTILAGMYYILNISVKQANSVYSNLLIDYARFDGTTDVDGLVEVNPISANPVQNIEIRPSIFADNSATSYEAFNGMIEDAYNARFQINTKQSTNDGLNAPVNTRIQSANWQIVARDTATGDEFICQNYPFDLTSSIEVPSSNALNPNPTEQVINLSNTRGFRYPLTDFLNEVKFEYLATSSSPNFQTTYEISVGFKLGWETWLSNPDVLPIFYDNTEPNDNLNNRISNYSEEQNYELFPVLNINVTNDEFQENGIDYPSSNTEYNLYFPSSIARTYGDDSIPKGNAPIHECLIETFKTSDGLSTGGVILTNEDMLIKATFDRLDGQALGYTNYAGAIRIDIQNGGLFSIEELSNLAIRVPISNGLLIPESGQTRTKMVITPTTVELSCLTDHTQLTSGSNYNLSARLWSSDEQPEPPIGNKEMENNTQKLMEDGTDKKLE